MEVVEWVGCFWSFGGGEGSEAAGRSEVALAREKELKCVHVYLLTHSLLQFLAFVYFTVLLRSWKRTICLGLGPLSSIPQFLRIWNNIIGVHFLLNNFLCVKFFRNQLA